MAGELFLSKSEPVNSFLSILFDLLNISLSHCTSFLPVEETMKANPADLQTAPPPLPAGLHGCVSRDRDPGLMWGAGEKTALQSQCYDWCNPRKMLLEKLNCRRCLCPSPVQWGDQEETMIQQVTAFLPGCSTGLWIKLRIDDLASKWEDGQSLLTKLIMIQVPCNPSVIYSHISRYLWFFPTPKSLLLLDESRSESRGK